MKRHPTRSDGDVETGPLVCVTDLRYEPPAEMATVRCDATSNGRGRVRRPGRFACAGKLFSSMAKDEPLTASEEQLWRALMRILVALPRHLDSDMVRAAGLSANEYKTLMGLSEAPHRELRMTELANTVGLSGSRMTRLVDELQSQGFVTKNVSSSDARGAVARLTPRGFSKVKSAWPAHLASARRRVLDHIATSDVDRTARALSEVAAQFQDRPVASRESE
jgi:DNA-binding MarR family transcriptional regulator